MTKKLYFNDAYKSEFSQKILFQEQYNNYYALAFPETYFFPTSGGQEHDLGSINGIEIIDIIENDDNILHIVKGKIFSENCDCKIDWKRRFDFMQQHTGQHILSESISKLSGYDTISSHLGNNSNTIDIKAKTFDFLKMSEIEEYANEIIYKNLCVNLHYVPDTEISKFPLRKPPKFTGELRIVEIDGFDYSACGGTHCQYTGEVGIIKIRKWEKIKGDLIRLEFFCGSRALRDYQLKNQYVNDLSNRLTISDTELYDKVLKIIDENKKSIKLIDTYKNELLKYESIELFHNAIDEKGVLIIKKIFENRDFSDIRIIAQFLTQNQNTLVLFGNLNNPNNIILARSNNLDIDLKNIFNVISGLYEVKGGGKPEFVQAGVSGEKMQEIIDFAYRNIEI